MSVPLIVLWIVAGWNLPFIPWWWIPDPGPEGPDQRVKPQPDPWIPGLVGAVGGVLGGWAYHATWVAGERLTGVEAASTVVGAVLGAGLLVSFYRLATRRATRAAR